MADHVFASSTEAITICIITGDFTESLRLTRTFTRIYKIGQQEVAISVQETILWLQISVDNALFMQCCKTNKDLCNVERGNIFGEHLFGIKIMEQFSPRSILSGVSRTLVDWIHFKNEIQLIRILKSIK